MCQQIIQFCSGSAKPLLFAGGFLSLLLAIGLGYTVHSNHSLYQDIDTDVDYSTCYYLQLAAAVYLALIAALSSFAGHYDQKHAIRALAVVTSVNFVLTVAAILLVQTEVSLSFKDRLNEARELYNFTDRYPDIRSNDPNINLSFGKNRSTRFANESAESNSISSKIISLGSNTNRTKLDGIEATKIWDSLQSRGCCGFLNSTQEWIASKSKIPKSCCSNPRLDSTQSFTCAEVDLEHKNPCKDIIDSTTFNLLIVLALIALVNLYLATVTGVGTYRTFHYDEASQNAYS